MGFFEKNIAGFLCLISLSGNDVQAQDPISNNNYRLDLLQEIDHRNWRVKIPVWVPGFIGTFAYRGFTQLPDGGDYNVIDRP